MARSFTRWSRSPSRSPARGADRREQERHMTRFVRFNVVGALGVAVQLGLLWLLTRSTRLPSGAATGVAVAATVVHNYIWHRCWTWRDRAGADRFAPFVAFVGSNGVVSLAGNVAIVYALTRTWSIRPVTASLIA